MVHRELVFHSAAREKILAGVNALADAIRITLGPKSKSVLLQREYGAPLVCNDGVTIAREARWKDPVQNLGAQMLRQAAERTADAVGDGTSTSSILAQVLFAEGVRNVTAGASAIDIKHGMERGLRCAIDALRLMSRPVNTRREKSQVAALSAHNDVAVGELVAEAMERVGDDGVITVEESKTTDTQLNVVEGMQFDRGYLSHYFVTDAEKMEAVLEQPYILVCNQKLSVLAPLVALLEQVAKTGKPLLVIAEDVEGDVMATLVLNQLRTILRSAAVKSPGYGDRRLAMLEDVAALTGAVIVHDATGFRLEDITLSQLGHADRVVVDKDSTTLIGGGGERARIDVRVNQIRHELQVVTSDYERDHLLERLARLTGGIAVIRVGAPVESEMKARRDALDDAIASTRAAVQEGIVPGGGLALLRCASALQKEESTLSGDEKTGVQIVRRALTAPARQIAENSDVDGGVVIARMQELDSNIGFDAAKNAYVDLIEAGIIDPAKVVRIALENAVSVASLLLLSEAVMVSVSDEPERPIMPE